MPMRRMPGLTQARLLARESGQLSACSVRMHLVTGWCVPSMQHVPVELRTSDRRLPTDYAAAGAGLGMDWSQRQVDRQVNRATLIAPRAYRDGLADQRSQLDTRLAAIGGALAALGVGARTAIASRPSAGARRAGPRRRSLREFIERVLWAPHGVMSVKDVTAAVRKAG